MSSTETDKADLYTAWFAVLIACVIAVYAVYYVNHVEGQRFEQSVKSETLQLLSKIRADIESRVHSDLQLFAGLTVEISLNPEIGRQQIANIIRGLMNRRDLIRSIGISRGYVVDQVYPPEGNEKAIGLNYLEHEAQREPVLRAVSNRQQVLAGPVPLVQGGQALIARLPVFVAQPSDGYPTGKFWGIVSVVLDLDLLYSRIGLGGDSALPVEVAIRGRDGLGRNGEVFLGRKALFDTDAVAVDISLPGGRWHMVGVPNQELIYTLSDHRPVLRGMGGILVLLVGLVTFVVTRQLQQQKQVIRVQERSRQQIWHAATHDRLTQMANRYLFNEELAHSLAKARRNDHAMAVLFLDIDHFKEINDSFGHRVGDQFLQSFASRLQSLIRDSEFVARLGGDEFAVIATEYPSIDALVSLAQRIIYATAKPIEIEHNTLHSDVSIGIAVYPNDGDTPEELLQNADVAMYSAKQDLLSHFAFFDESMNREVQERKRLVEDLRRALDRKEFYLMYQPVIDIAKGEVSGIETLCRWKSPARGEISPGEFIPVAELSGLIIPLGDWILQQSAREAMALRSELDRLPVLSINLSPIQLHRGKPLELVETTLAETGLAPDQLDVEITESAILEDVQVATRVVQQLRKLGVSVTIDDFGTGYSSLSHLRHLPVNRIKIDLSFVQMIGKDHHSEAIIKAILYLSQTLNVRITAEGVETEAQLSFLRDLGCNEIQGYYFSAPQTMPEVLRYIQNFAGDSLSKG